MIEAFEILLGAVLPPVIDVLNAKIDNKGVRYVVSLGVCLLAGFLLNIGNLNGFLTSGTIIFASAQSVYKLYFENSKIRKTIKKKL